MLLFHFAGVSLMELGSCHLPRALIDTQTDSQDSREVTAAQTDTWEVAAAAAVMKKEVLCLKLKEGVHNWYKQHLLLKKLQMQ